MKIENLSIWLFEDGTFWTLEGCKNITEEQRALISFSVTVRDKVEFTDH